MKNDYTVLCLWHQCDGLPVGSTLHLESAADGCNANWCQINGHAALEQFRARPSFPTALPQPCPLVLGHVRQPAPSQPRSLTLPSKSVLFRTQCSMNTERWRIGLHGLPVGRQQIVLLSLSLSLCTGQNLFFGLSCLPFFPPSTLFIWSSASPSVFLPSLIPLV